jgi:hypothetical protein
MDYNHWVEAVQSSNDTGTLVSLFEELGAQLALSLTIDFFDIKRLLEAFKFAFGRVTDEAALVVVLDALACVIRYSEHDIEHYIKDTLPHVVVTFLDFKVVVKKAARHCLQMYLVKTRNIDDVVSEYIRSGLLSKNVKMTTSTLDQFENSSCC